MGPIGVCRTEEATRIGQLLARELSDRSTGLRARRILASPKAVAISLIFGVAGDSLERALSTASRMGLLMIVFKTAPVVPAVSEPESTALGSPTTSARPMVKD